MPVEFQSVTVELTQQCNLSCLYCYNYWKSESRRLPQKASSYRQHKKLMRTLIRKVPTKHIVLTGGEPFTLDHLLDLCLFVRMKGKRVSIVSNGTNEDAALYKNLLAIGVKSFMLPLHSMDPGAHDSMTRTPGSWPSSLASIRNIISLGDAVSAAIVVTKLNYRGLGDTIDLLHASSVNRFMLDRVTLAGEAVNNPEIIPRKDELMEAFASADSAGDNGTMEIRSNICTPECMLDPSQFVNIRFSTCPNAAGVVSPLIDAEGNIRACTVSPTVIGNIYRDQVEAVFNSLYLERSTSDR